MKKDKKILKSASLVAGALLTTTFAAAPALGGDLLAYNDLGSGAQVRSHLIDMNTNQAKAAEATAYKFGELKCGEGKCGDDKKEAATKATAKTAEAAEAKTAEAKCGEGKCGDDKKAAATKAVDTKAAEATKKVAKKK